MTDHDHAEAEPRMVPERSAPPITDALRAEARANPGGWVYAVDPGYDGSPNVPPQGILGAWKTDERGELSEEFTPNPRYLPTPQARGWTKPTTNLERVMQLVLSGYLPDDQLAREFASAEVFIYNRPEGGIFLAPAEDGGQLVYAFTDADQATASGNADNAPILGKALAEALPKSVRIALNAGQKVSAIIYPDDVTSE